MIALYYWNNCCKDGFLKTEVESEAEANWIHYVLEHQFELVELEHVFLSQKEFDDHIDSLGICKHVKKITKVHFKEYEEYQKKYKEDKMLEEFLLNNENDWKKLEDISKCLFFVKDDEKAIGIRYQPHLNPCPEVLVRIDESEKEMAFHICENKKIPILSNDKIVSDLFHSNDSLIPNDVLIDVSNMIQTLIDNETIVF